MDIEQLKQFAKEKKITLPPFPTKYLTSVSLEIKEDESLFFFCQAKEGKTDGTFFVTSKRLGFIKFGVFSGTSSVSLDIDKINSVTKNKGILNGEIEVWDNSGKVIYSMPSLHVDMAEKAINDAKNANKTTSNNINQTGSAADEILKFKNLLDQGIITQDEFNQKKKELLGL